VLNLADDSIVQWARGKVCCDWHCLLVCVSAVGQLEKRHTKPSHNVTDSAHFNIFLARPRHWRCVEFWHRDSGPVTWTRVAVFIGPQRHYDGRLLRTQRYKIITAIRAVTDR